MFELQSALYQVADELRSIANQGKGYAQNEYDAERYRRVFEISQRLIALVDENPTAPMDRTPHADNWEHISPAAGAEAMVVRENRVLLIQRTDNHLWAIPGGLVEVGETLAEAAVRELWEEAGLRGHATQVLGIFDSRRWQDRSRVQFYGTVFQVEAGTTEPVAGSEAEAVGFFGEDELPPLSPGHDKRVPLLFRILRGEVAVPYFDPNEPDFQLLRHGG